jgi:DinB superfamily
VRLSEHLQRLLPRTTDHTCETCGLAHATLSPADEAVALRSLPRRFRERIDGAVESDGANAISVKHGACGRSPLDHLADAGRTLQLILGQLDRVLILDRPSLDDLDHAVVDPASGPDDVVGEGDPDALLAGLAAVADRLARRAEEVPAQDWQRTGHWHGAEVSALDLLQLAVHEGVAHLRAFDRAIADERAATG